MAAVEPPAPDAKAPYETGVTSELWREAVTGWDWSGSSNDGWRKSGPCPRCGHMLVVSVTGGVNARGVLPINRKVLARCACSGEHANHPERANRDWGCGFSCLVAMPEG